MYPSWWKNRTLSHFSKPNFDMPWPNCWKPYKVNGDPQLFIFLLVQKNIYSHSPLCTRLLTPVLAEIWFFKSFDRGCRTKGPLPNLGRLTVHHDRWAWVLHGNDRNYSYRIKLAFWSEWWKQRVLITSLWMEEKSSKQQMMTLSIGLFYDANRYLKVSYYCQMPAFGFKKSQEKLKKPKVSRFLSNVCDLQKRKLGLWERRLWTYKSMENL